MRNIYIVLFFLFQSGVVFAEAPELKNVMPNSWQRLVRLTDSEEKKFLITNKNIIDTKVKHLKKTQRLFNKQNLNEILNVQVYKETVGAEDFYRVIFSNDNDINYMLPDCKFVQLLVYKNIMIASCAYSIREEIQVTNNNRELFMIYENIEIIGINNTVSGILITTVSTAIDNNGNFVAKRKGQFYGKNESYFFSFFNKTIDNSTNIWYCGRSFSTEAMLPTDHIWIRAPYCLIDRNIPLRYSLQNAFDNNPATSYVENTESDLMYIDFFTQRDMSGNDGITLFSTKAFAIINGYAQNNSLYYNNNHIKEIAYNTKIYEADGAEKWWKNVRANAMNYSLNEFSTISLPEKTGYSIQSIKPGNPFNYQVGQDEYYDISRLFLLVTDIYKGNKYNDTCIAEINIKTENGWLFGDIEN